MSCKSETIKLNPNNHYFLEGQVDRTSMAIALSELQRLDKELPRGAKLYLVLKTPGGSVMAGMDFIRAVKHLSRPVSTITIRSMSMGFQIVEALGERLILKDGIMMTHPIAGDCEGRVQQIKSCVAFMELLAITLDRDAAKRMNMSLSEYQVRSSEEWFEIGLSAIAANMSDRIVEIQCSKDMNEKDQCPN